MLAAEHVAHGMSAEEAQAAAQRDMGGTLRARELYRDQQGLVWLDHLWRDFKHALRSLNRAPALTAAVIATLALGIGANTAIFSIVRTVLLKPLPFPHAERLMWITEYDGMREFEGTPVAQVRDWVERSQSFEVLAAAMQQDTSMTVNGSSVPVSLVYVSAPISSLLGVRISIGRDFSPDESTVPPLRPAQSVALISARVYRDQFGGDPAVLGQTISTPITGSSTIVGVLPEDFHLPLPGRDGPQTDAGLIVNYGNGLHALMGRLKVDVSMAAARGELAAMRLDKSRELRVTSLQERITGKTRQELLILWAAVGCVLLVACVNVANLLLARFAVQGREFAVRAALGASRVSILRRTLLETGVLALLGGAIGIALSVAAMRYFAEFGPLGFPRIREVELDRTILFYGLVCCAVAGLACGLPIAWGAIRADINSMLRRGEGSSSSSRWVRLWHAGLAVSQLTLALLLTTGSGLLLKSLWTARSSFSHAQPERVLVATMEPGTNLSRMGPQMRLDGVRQKEQINQFLEHIRAIPGVTAAGIEMSGSTIGRETWIEGAPPAPYTPWNLFASMADEGYFRAAGYRLLAGRLFQQRQISGLPEQREIMVNTEFVRTFAPTLRPPDAIGRRVMFKVQGQPHTMGTITGLMNDLNTRRNALPEPRVFWPIEGRDTPIYTGSLLVRTTGDPLGFVDRIRRASEQNGHRMGKGELLEDRLTVAIATRQFESQIFVLFASLAVLLAAVGLFGVLNCAVADRTRELGVRIAVGASTMDILGAVLTQGLKLAFSGIVLGSIASFLFTRWMQSMLFGVTFTDPVVFVTVCALMLAVAIVAAWLPAIRATRVDPAVTLRDD